MQKNITAPPPVIFMKQKNVGKNTCPGQCENPTNHTSEMEHVSHTMCTCACVRACLRAYVRACVCVRACLRVYVRVRVCVCVYKHPGVLALAGKC